MPHIIFAVAFQVFAVPAYPILLILIGMASSFGEEPVGYTAILVSLMAPVRGGMVGRLAKWFGRAATGRASSVPAKDTWAYPTVASVYP